MADRFEDPRIEGELRELNSKLSQIEKNVAEAEAAARRAEQGTRRAQPAQSRPSRPLDEDVRATETARRRASEEERAAKAKERGARAAETEARFEARRSGQRSAAIYDRESGDLVRRFRGGAAGQDEAIRKAREYAKTLNQAGRAAERIGQDLIRHPQLFGRQVYANAGRIPPAYPARPPGGVAAAESRVSQATIGLREAQAAERAAINSKVEANVTAARATREAAQQELAAAQANVQATRAEVAARQQAVAQMRGLTAAERTAHQQQIAALRAQAAAIERAAVTQARPALPPGRPVGLLPQYADDAQRRAREEAAAERVRQARQQTVRSFVGGQDPVDQAVKAERVMPRAATATRTYGDALAFTGREQALAANQMRRHGALTSEFIEAAARGRTTIRELGYQVGATIGKFAGWTAAATAVFGAAAAIRELGVGAIDSAEGVNNLTRIIPDIDREAAAASISGLSRKFNVPIGDVGDAAYQISKVFGSIKSPVEAANATFKATESVLFAMKVGELDVATATRYLTGIIQGFKLDASDLPDLFDTINQAQNRFGGNVGQITQGVAQAAGAFSSAGGSYRELIALIQTGSRVTGRTGAEIGTALRRTADIYQRPERRQTILDLIGIDPRGKTVVEVIEAAMEAVRGAAPELQSQIAKAISTPELSSGRILPILRQRDLYREIQRGISPSESAGSATKELERALRGPREQLSRLRVDLQALGAELATSGFLAPFETLVQLLDRALLLTKGIANAIGNIRDLPGGDVAATAAAYALPAAAGIGLARRFDVGGGRGLLGRGAGASTRANLLSGLRAEEEAIQSERVRAASEIRTSANRSQRLQRQIVDIDGQMVGDDEADAELTRRRGQLSAQLGRTNQQMLDAESDLDQLHKQHATVLQQQRVVTKSRLRGEAEVLRRYRDAGGVYTQPVPHGAVPYGPSRIDPLRGPQAPILPTGGFVDPARGPQSPLRDVTRQQNRLARYMTQFSASVTPLGASGRVLGAGATKAASAAGGAGGALRGAARGLTGAAGALAAAIGPLDLVIAGLIAFIALEEALDAKNKEVAQAARAMNRQAGPVGLAQEIRASQQNIDSTGTKITSAFEEIENVGRGLGEVAGVFGIQNAFGEGKGLDRIFQGVTTPQEELREQTERQRQRLAYLRRQQEKGRLYYQGNIRAQLRTRFESALPGSQGDEEREKAVEEARRDYRNSLAVRGRGRNRPGARTEKALTRDLIAQLRGEAAATAGNVSAFRQALDEVDSATSAEALVRGLTQRVSQRGVGATIGRTTQALAHLRALAARTKDTAEREAILEQATQLKDAVLSRIESEFQRQLASGADPGRARRRYLSTASLVLFGVRTQQELNDLEERRRQLIQAIRLMQKIISDANARLNEIASSYLSGDPHAAEEGPRARRQEAGERLQRLRRQLNRIGPPASRDDLDAFRDLQKDSQDAVDQIVDEAEQDAASRLAEAISLFQAQQRNASARSLIGASQGARLQRAVSDAQSFLGFLQSHGADKLQILDASTAVFEAQDALAQYVREQAQALIRAKAELATSRTYDPVKVALIRLKEAQALLQYAETPAERIQGLAEINNRKRELQGTRVQERVDQQQFLFDLGKLTREQYADWIRRFLRNHQELRRVNKEMFRQLRRTLHQLTSETEEDLDLQVGNIRTPTLYDVRRLIKQGTRTAPQGVIQQTNQFQIDGSGDPEATAAAVGSVLRTSTKSGLRAAGLTG